MKTNQFLTFLIGSFVLLTSMQVRAQGTGTDVDSCAKPDAANIVKCYSNDIAVPDSPGLMIVGLGTDNVLRPTTAKQFGAALSKGVDDKGNPASGFALDFAPYKIFGESTKRSTYEKHAVLVRPLWNTQISAGVGKSDDSNAKTLKVGYGISSVLWRSRNSDPILSEDHESCLKNALLSSKLAAAAKSKPIEPPATAPIASTPPDPSSVPAPVAVAPAVAAVDAAADEAARKAAEDARRKEILDRIKNMGSNAISIDDVDNCNKKFDSDFRNATALTVGFATSQVSEDGEWGHRRKGATGTWATFSYALPKFPKSLLKFKPELSLQWRDLRHQRVEDPESEGTFVDQSSTLYGIVARLHGERMNFIAEKNWLRKKLPQRASDRSNKFGVGVEFKLMENTWIVVAFGGEDALAGNGDETHFRTGIKFGKSENSLFSAQ